MWRNDEGRMMSMSKLCRRSDEGIMMENTMQEHNTIQTPDAPQPTILCRYIDSNIPVPDSHHRS